MQLESYRLAAKRIEASPPHVPPPGLNRPALFWPLLTAVVLMLTFLTFAAAPPPTESEAYEADPSLSAILNYADQHHLQFGTQFVYTYGPLGYLVFPYFYPHAMVLRMVLNAALCLGVALGVCLAAWNLPRFWRYALLAGFAWVTSNLDLRVDLIINCGLLCWGMLCLVESGRRLALSTVAFACLAVFAALAKISFLFVAGGSIAALAVDFALRGRIKSGLALLAGSVAGFIGGWLLAGQKLGNLAVFVTNAVAMVRGYNAALGWEELPVAWQGGLALAMGALALILARTATAFPGSPGRTGLRRVVAFGWIFLLSLTVWKHGFVRGYIPDLLGYFAYMFVLVLVLELLPCTVPEVRRWGFALSTSCALLSLILLQLLWSQDGLASLQQPLRSVATNLHWLGKPADYMRQQSENISHNRQQASLPRVRQLVGNSSADLFGRRQAYAIFNGLNYQPRPSPQSYAVCNSQLMRLNEGFYLSPAAPEYVLFELLSLDRKLPALEDAWTLRTLLCNYKAIAVEGRFLLLKANSAEPPKLSRLKEGSVLPGQSIDLSPFADTDLWIEVQLRPTWLGRLRQFFYRPPTVRIAAWDTPQNKLLVRNRAPASMLEAGFLASPILLRTEDVLSLYTIGGPVKRPKAYSIELLPGEGKYWQPDIQFRVYRVENQLGRSVPAAMTAQWTLNSAQSSTEPGSQKAYPPASVLPLKPTAGRFNLFRNPRWHPTRPEDGVVTESLTFGVFLVLPLIFLCLFAALVKRVRGRPTPAGWAALLVGNAFLLLFLLSLLLLAGEIYFRFVYDTTDSLGYTKVSEHWVRRHWHVNAAGCRDDVEYAPTIAPGKRRVTFIGDSFAAGHGIKNVDDRFENRLRAAHPNWEVHVLANVGLDTGAEQILLNRALAKGYQLDEVVLVYCLNDVGDLMPEESEAYQQIFASLDSGGWFARHSYFVNLLYHRYKARQIPMLRDYFPSVRTAYSGPAWEQQRQRLKAIRDVVEAHGGHLSVMIFPFFQALGHDYEYQFAHDELDQLWSELNVPHLDLLQVYKGRRPAELVVNPYDAHPNELANQLAAEALERFLPPAMARPGSSE